MHTQDTTFAVSPSGYMDDELGLSFSKHFDKHTGGRGKRILIVDGHSSHIAWYVEVLETLTPLTIN